MTAIPAPLPALDRRPLAGMVAVCFFTLLAAAPGATSGGDHEGAGCGGAGLGIAAAGGGVGGMQIIRAMGRSADDVARVGTMGGRHVDDLVHVGALGDDLARPGASGSRAARGVGALTVDDAARIGSSADGLADDVARSEDLLEELLRETPGILMDASELALAEAGDSGLGEGGNADPTMGLTARINGVMAGEERVVVAVFTDGPRQLVVFSVDAAGAPVMDGAQTVEVTRTGLYPVTRPPGEGEIVAALVERGRGGPTLVGARTAD
ncbi:MAG: hypothetical protein H6739_34080 [Alphaproteobacteria bacterium]|nr:hypothetical protein [Alphaproteobacteria bacterium]